MRLKSRTIRLFIKQLVHALNNKENRKTSHFLPFVVWSVTLPSALCVYFPSLQATLRREKHNLKQTKTDEMIVSIVRPLFREKGFQWHDLTIEGKTLVDIRGTTYKCSLPLDMGAAPVPKHNKQDCFLQNEARVCVSNAFVLEDSMFK